MSTDPLGGPQSWPLVLGRFIVSENTDALGGYDRVIFQRSAL